ncbi:rRNA maturation RNase YbeY [Candidatus Venteria ishoeyi]|uniref:Endoribonuclease YbeY n=1 Tax=Candidatus Venteria ishoeyi TaxID=1899563 RepID=A0A1H6FC17_9GAMM|nr:rRNA maturation RNase YbeY [Candidatus Venteria ishoeyi]SEH04253.1 Endoribonuclease YbeY [Candidatus Venteria ishoeyi]SEH06584.1 Endoribonuclease YbeY [Candidatus Venteria ishoeyi]
MKPDALIPELELDIQYISENQQIPDTGQFQQWAQATLQVVSHNAVEPYQQTLQEKWQHLHQQLDDFTVFLSLRIVDETEGTELNETWRNKSGPTNVLSFPFDPAPGMEDMPLLGDIVICAPVVEAEAKQQRKLITAHWAHLLVHGVLHLLGFDHIDAEEAQVMETLEIQVLQDLGYDNPY